MQPGAASPFVIVTVAWFLGCTPDLDSAASPGDTAETADTAEPPTLPEGIHALPSIDCTTPREGADPVFTPLDDDPGVRAQDMLTQFGEGLSVGDLDGDGARDLVLVHGERVMLLMGTPGTVAFTEQTEARLGTLPVAPRFVSILDLDEDGDQDLLYLDLVGAPTLFLNDGVGFFTPGALSGWTTLTTKVRSLSWADPDADGDLDVYQANDGTGGNDPDDLWLRRIGVYSFEDHSPHIPADVVSAYTKVATWIDVDGDGDDDLYVANHEPVDYGGNKLYLNDGTGDLTGDPGAGLDLTMAAMGISWADINGDALPDILISDLGDPRLFESLGDGTWFEAALASGLYRVPPDLQFGGWGNALEDLDNDGDVDAMMMFGRGSAEETENYPNPEGQPDALWLKRDAGFEAVGAALGVDDPTDGRALGVVDLDGDGTLDFVTAPREAPSRVWHGACGEEAWVTISVNGPPGNIAGAGARVQIESNGVTQTRWLLQGGTSLQVSLPVEAHFGLGGAERIDVLRVTLPGHAEVVAENVPVNARLAVDVLDSPAP